MVRDDVTWGGWVWSLCSVCGCRSVGYWCTGGVSGHTSIGTPSFGRGSQETGVWARLLTTDHTQTDSLRYWLQQVTNHILSPSLSPLPSLPPLYCTIISSLLSRYNKLGLDPPGGTYLPLLAMSGRINDLTETSMIMSSVFKSADTPTDTPLATPTLSTPPTSTHIEKVWSFQQCQSPLMLDITDASISYNHSAFINGKWAWYMGVVMTVLV